MNRIFTAWTNLRYWSFHVTLNAAPSFIIALGLSTDHWDTKITGIVTGVIFFILVYTMLTSSSWFRNRISGGSFEKALRLATRIRSSMAAIVTIGALGWIPSLKLSFLSILAMGEVWAGLVSGFVVEGFGKLGPIRILRIAITGNDAGERAKSWWLGEMNSTIPIFLWTVTEGLILSMLMLAIAVTIYLIGRVRRRKSTIAILTE